MSSRNRKEKSVKCLAKEGNDFWFELSGVWKNRGASRNRDHYCISIGGGESAFPLLRDRREFFYEED